MLLYSKKKLRNCSISPQFKNFKYEMPFNCVLNIPLNKCYIKTLVVFCIFANIYLYYIQEKKCVNTIFCELQARERILNRKLNQAVNFKRYINLLFG